MSLEILIADDHEVVRLGLRTLIDNHPDFSVVAEAATVKDAVRKTLLLRPDVVVMDIRLLGGSGIDACEQISERAPGTKVIMLTSYAEDEMLFDAIAAGACGYVLKQIGNEDLIRALETVASGEALLDPALTQRVFDRVREAARKEHAEAFADLTDQEMRVLAQVAEGKTNREIADELYLGEGTVRNYVSSILSKLDLSNRTEAAAYSVQHGLKEFL
ncbi:MAG: response regulator transcription factor [Anaerolineae bacterium]|jgi:DNA-binding NarL/FixJ family response regulator